MKPANKAPSFLEAGVRGKPQYWPVPYQQGGKKQISGESATWEVMPGVDCGRGQLQGHAPAHGQVLLEGRRTQALKCSLLRTLGIMWLRLLARHLEIDALLSLWVTPARRPWHVISWFVEWMTRWLLR